MIADRFTNTALFADLLPRQLPQLGDRLVGILAEHGLSVWSLHGARVAPSRARGRPPQPGHARRRHFAKHFYNDSMPIFMDRSENPMSASVGQGSFNPDNEMTLLPSSQPDPQATLPPGESTGSPDALERIPGYEIIAELGRGGMGVVYQARQLGLKRLCALKMILAAGHAGPSDLARFTTEAEALARLQHPNIVSIYEIGTHQGKPFFSMEYCPGGSLDRKLNHKPLDPRQAARLVRTLAEAMHAAHRANIIHRDLKPANVLLASPGRESGELIPKITDFGLAKKLDDSSQTQTGAIMGTPSYMAPEQASGQKNIGPAADIYALGAILYECLTGRPPFQAATPLDTLLQVLEHTPLPPQMLNPAVPRDLQTICLKCLEKEPRQRYASAEALANDLARWLSGETITARSYNLLDRLKSVLDRSQYDVQFTAWGNMLLGFAVVIGLGHVATTGVLLMQSIETAILTVTWIHAAMFAALLLLFWRNRPEGLLPRTTAEQQLWCVLGGFVLSCILTGITDRLMATSERPHEPLRMYPLLTVLSGLAFLVLGSSYWGACYLFTAIFWGLALLLPWWLELGPAAFGLVWTAALVTIGLRLRRLARENQA
jgi:serine/threonine protein kinase